jgi:hypothetical protein
MNKGSKLVNVIFVQWLRLQVKQCVRLVKRAVMNTHAINGEQHVDLAVQKSTHGKNKRIGPSQKVNITQRSSNHAPTADSRMMSKLELDWTELTMG